MGRKRLLFPARAKSDEHATVETFWIKVGGKRKIRKQKQETNRDARTLLKERHIERQNDRPIEIEYTNSKSERIWLFRPYYANLFSLKRWSSPGGRRLCSASPLASNLPAASDSRPLPTLAPISKAPNVFGRMSPSRSSSSQSRLRFITMTLKWSSILSSEGVSYSSSYRSIHGLASGINKDEAK